MGQPDQIVGSRRLKNGRVIADDVCIEIRRMIGEKLIEVAQDQTGWLKLFHDIETGSYWELDFPQGESHGGGPPRLRKVELADVQDRYKT